MIKSKMLPFFPDEKSNQASFWSLTKKDGVFSLLNGDRPFNSRPERCNFTRRPTTSETGRRAFNSSRNWGVKRMVQAVWPNRLANHRPQNGEFSGPVQEPALAAE